MAETGATARSVLIALDDPSAQSAIATRCAQAGLTVRIAADGPTALTQTLAEPPGLLIVDFDLPAGDGLTVAETFGRDPRPGRPPVIFLTAPGDARAVRYCRALGAHHVAQGADAWDAIKAIIDRRLPAAAPARAPAPAAVPQPAAAPAARPRVLLVDDDANVLRALTIRLRASGFDILAEQDPMQAFWTALKENPDAIISDYSMREANGTYLMSRLKGAEGTKDIPVLMLTGWKFEGRADFAHERDVLSQGAAAYIRKPPDMPKLIAELSDQIAIRHRPKA